MKSQASDDLKQHKDQQINAKNESVLKSDGVASGRDEMTTKMDQLTVRESESLGSKVAEELTIRYWKALQAHLARAGIDLKV